MNPAHRTAIQQEFARPAAALGQAVRMVLAVFATAIGVFPPGNTGGSNVSMFKRMTIDAGLLEIMRGSGASNSNPCESST